jgi:lantibiotic transport system permease protein
MPAAAPIINVPGVHYPNASLPAEYFLWENLHYAVDCLPIVMLQYLISLRYRNFLLPIGLGFVFWFGSLSAVSWKFGYVIPYTYGMYNYFRNGTEGKALITAAHIHAWAFGYAIVFLIGAYVFYVTKREKG